jgi:hypothetical protein
MRQFSAPDFPTSYQASCHSWRACLNAINAAMHVPLCVPDPDLEVFAAAAPSSPSKPTNPKRCSRLAPDNAKAGVWFCAVSSTSGFLAFSLPSAGAPLSVWVRQEKSVGGLLPGRRVGFLVLAAWAGVALRWVELGRGSLPIAAVSPTKCLSISLLGNTSFFSSHSFLHILQTVPPVLCTLLQRSLPS